MAYDPAVHHRKSIRLPRYDYASPGAYFVTPCVQGRECLFGEVSGDTVLLNDYGRIVESTWKNLPAHFPNLILDVFQVMPNHAHGILVFDEKWGKPVGAGSPRPYRDAATCPRPCRPTLGHVMAYWKYQSTRLINDMRGTPGRRLWQRNYHDHIIRNDLEMARIRWYIEQNPAMWRRDRNHPAGPVDPAGP